DPAGARADHHLLALEDVAEARTLRHQESLRESRRAASGPRSGSNRKGRVLTGASTRRRSRASCARWLRARPNSESAARAAAFAAPSSAAASAVSFSASSFEK